MNFDTNDHGKFLPYNFIENSIWSRKHLLSTGYTSLPNTSNTRQWKIGPPRGVFFGAHRPWQSFHLQIFPNCRQHPSSLKRRRRSSVNWQLAGAHAIGRMFDSVWSLEIRSLDLVEFLTRNYPISHIQLRETLRSWCRQCTISNSGPQNEGPSNFMRFV